MKKIVFTLMIMLALVVITNVTFAQGTKLLPWSGEVYTYSVDGLTDADTYTFVVNQDNTDYTAGQNAGDGSDYNLPGTLTGNPSGNSASVQIEWLTAGTYYLWIEMVDAVSLCTNYRFVEIVVTNHLDFEIYTAAIGDGTSLGLTDIDDEDITTNLECAVIDGSEDWDDTDGSSNDGSTWVYYRIVRTGGSTSGWTFDFSATNGGGTTTIDGYYGSADGSGWSDIGLTLDNISVAGTSDVYYVRVKVAQAADLQLITGSITDGKEAVTTDSTPGTEDATLTVTATPTIGNFN